MWLCYKLQVAKHTQMEEGLLACLVHLEEMARACADVDPFA